MVITSANINRFSKFFHWLIPKKTVWLSSYIAIFTSPLLCCTLPCEIRKFTITAKLMLVQEILICFTLRKVNRVQNMLFSMWTNKVIFKMARSTVGSPNIGVCPHSTCWPKFTSFWDDVGDTLLFATHLPAYVYHISFQRYGPLNLALSCEIVEKGGFGPPICRGKDTHISDMHFQIALTSDHVAGYGWVPFSELRVYSWRKKKKERRRIRGKT